MYRETEASHRHRSTQYHKAALCGAVRSGSRRPHIQPDGEFMSRRQAQKTLRRAPAVPGILPDDLYDYMDDTTVHPRAPETTAKTAPPQRSLQGWTVSDDWPERVPVTDAEIDLFEVWFGDILDEIFGKSV